MRRLSLLVMILWSLLGCEATVNRHQVATPLGGPANTTPRTPVTRSQTADPRGEAANAVQRGDAAYERQDYALALREWQPSAQQGHAAAQVRLGYMDEHGFGVAKNEVEAVRLYRLAAAQGHATAQFNLGRMYEQGRGVARDLGEAHRWFVKAAETAAPGSDRETMLQARGRVARQLATSPSPTPNAERTAAGPRPSAAPAPPPSSPQSVVERREHVVVSPDRTREASVVHQGAKQIVVLNGQPGVLYDRVAADTLTFSPDSKRVAYAAQAGPKWIVVVDGQAGPPYAGIGEVVFSPDSKRLAYAVQVGPKRLIVVDGRAEPPYEDLVAKTLVFSPDSRHLAYGAITGYKEVVVLDGKPGVPYEGIGAGSVIFSPDSKRLAYAVQAGAKWAVVVDGKKGAPYEVLVSDSLQFSPDSKNLTYTARVGQQLATIVDGHLDPRQRAASPAARSQPAAQGPTARIEELIGLLTAPEADQGAKAAVMLIAIGQPVVAPLQRQREVWQQQVTKLKELLALRGAIHGGGPGTEPRRENYPRDGEGQRRYEDDKGYHAKQAPGFYTEPPDQLRSLWRALGFTDKVLKEVQSR